MYKVMIVDDDRIIRKGLMKTIPWAEHGFKLVGEAGDGEQALAIIEQEQPEIIVSDIKMPFMDGLELARRTREINPAIKFIFLTGFEDFSYAKAAIDLQAVDYLLKPVERDVLLAKVEKAAAAYEKEQGSETQLQEAQPYLRAKLFQRILAGEDDESLVREGAHLSLDLDHAYVCALLARIDDYAVESVHPAVHHRELKANLANGMEACIAYTGLTAGVYALEHDAFAVLVHGDAEEDFAGVKELGEKLCNYVRENFSATITIGIGTVQRGLTGTAASFDDAHAVLEFRHLVGKDTVITPDDIDRLTPEVQERTDTQEDLVEKVRLGLVDDALQLLATMEEELCTSRLPLGDVRMRAVDMLLGLFKGAESWAPAWCDKFKPNKTKYYSQINSMQTVTEIMELLRSLVDNLAQFMVDENENSRLDIIDEVTSYIETHYAEHSLSLQDIGQHVHMNPIYLSVLFKKKKRITFTAFLLQVRMKKAMELLRATSLKTYEVAEQIGYNSPEYFGACFKKYTGTSPLEFRNRS